MNQDDFNKAVRKVAESKKLGKSSFCILQHLIHKLTGNARAHTEGKLEYTKL